jgi:hypothetical protein
MRLERSHWYDINIVSLTSSCNHRSSLPQEPIVMERGINLGLAQTLIVTVMCVLGPRLILGIREYHAKLVAKSEGGLHMIPIAFQERVHVSTSVSV